LSKAITFWAISTVANKPRSRNAARDELLPKARVGEVIGSCRFAEAIVQIGDALCGGVRHDVSFPLVFGRIC
jgi:hypothetical protein